jgi:predicted metalloprotease
MLRGPLVNHSAARLILAIAVALTTLTSALGTPPPAVASHLPPPSELVVRPGDLPPGLEPVDASGVAAMLPDNLARQAAVLFRRDAAAMAEPGMREVKQVVLTFDDREATEYLPRFRDLMVRHQGYAAISGDESTFHLTRTHADETSVVAGTAFAEILVLTTVAGVAGTVGPADAARLTGIAVARVPSVDQSAAVLTTEPGAASLAAAGTGVGYLEIPNQQDAGRWPEPTSNLPGPPEIAIVQARNSRALGDRSLDAMMPVHQTSARPAGWPADLMTYTKSIEPLLNEFWNRSLSMTDVHYLPPRFMVIPEGVDVAMGCMRAPGVPALAKTLAYCAVDETIYIYEPFMRDELVAGEDWRSRDYVVATVIAHEWGHHIQNLTGLLDLSIAQVINTPDRWPLITRQKELQADCYAGMFTRYARDRAWLNPGDVDEAREALLRAGDDHIDSPGHHGLPDQRKEWFTRGYVHYAFRACEPW